jgi:hypothetical protein
MRDIQQAQHNHPALDPTLSLTFPPNTPTPLASFPSTMFSAFPAALGSNMSAPSLAGVELVSCTFCAFNPTISNCTVLGPRDVVHYHVKTNPGERSSTLLLDLQGSAIAEIQWSEEPVVTIRRTMWKVADWLVLSSDQR